MTRSAIFFLLAVLLLGCGEPEPEWRSYRVTERYAFTDVAPGTTASLAVVVPLSGPYQRVGEVEVDWPGEVEREEDGAVRIVLLTATAPADGRCAAALTYDCSVLDGPARWEGEAPPEDLAPAPLIESDAPPIVAEAKRLGQDAFGIFSFVADHVEVAPATKRVEDGVEVWSGGTGSALTTYESASGGCHEYANLTVAICRAAGIPARSIGGLAFPRMDPGDTATATWGHPAGAHAWIEVRVGGAWTMADPCWAAGRWSKRRWFGKDDGRHLSYGEAGASARRYRRLESWARERGELVAAMSAPIRFAAAVGKGKATFTPEVAVTRLDR